MTYEWLAKAGNHYSDTLKTHAMYGMFVPSFITTRRAIQDKGKNVWHTVMAYSEIRNENAINNNKKNYLSNSCA